MAVKKVEEIRLGKGTIKDTVIQSVWKAEDQDPASSDGNNSDIWITVSGARSNIFQKINGYWISLAEKPVITNLLDNQTNAVAVELPLSVFRNAEINYVIKRGGNNRKIKGTLQIVHDGSNIQYSDEFIEIGLSDVGVDLSVDISGAFLRILYTSTNESIAPVLEWYVKGWE